MAKRILLDSRDWITLARVNNGKEKNPILINVLEKIKKLSESGDILVPFSMYHIEDILKNSDKTQREYLIDFMISISKGWVMKPFRIFFNKEIENAILQKLGKDSIHDIYSLIIGRGLAYIAGEEYHISSPNPKVQKMLDEKQSELRELTDSIESMAKLLKQEGFSTFVKQGKKSYDNLATALEKGRQLRLKLEKKQRYGEAIVDYFTYIINPHLSKFIHEFQIPKEILHFNNEKNFEVFLECMPSINTFFRLSYARDEESPERAIQPNDVIDISHLSGGVPYCDIVVMEKMFSNLCRKIKLDKKYDCIVLSQLKDLDEII